MREPLLSYGQQGIGKTSWHSNMAQRDRNIPGRRLVYPLTPLAMPIGGAQEVATQLDIHIPPARRTGDRERLAG